MRCVVIGGDAAGMSAASQIRRRQPDWKLTVLEKGAFTSYAACGIPYLFAGDIEHIDDLVVVTPEQFREKRGIDVCTGWEATSIDTHNKRITVRTPEEETHLEYDRLLLATGAEPIVPDWEGVDLDGVSVLRNLVHTHHVQQLLERDVRKVVLIGAGYVGLEMAEAFSRRGLQVKVVEKQAGVMGGGTPTITERVQKELAAHGVDLHLSTTVQGFSGAKGKLQAVHTDQGVFDADLALVSLGVRPRSQLAYDAGLELGPAGTVHVDDHLRTSVPDVWAAGDCAEAYHRVLQRPVFVPLALGANRQGRVAGANMAGGDERFPGIVGSAVTKVYELAIGRTGIDAQTAADAGIPVTTVTASGPSRAHYMPGHQEVWIELVYRTDDQRVVGAQLVGHDRCLGKRCDILATAITAGMTVQQLSDLDLSYSPPFSPVWDPVLQVANKARFKASK